MNKHPSQRRDEILRLVRGGTVRSQVDLRRRLSRRGFAVTQPTLSRDLRDLGLARTPTGYAAPAEPARFVPGARREEALDRTLARMVLEVRLAGALLVLRTPPAGAQPVARVLDESGLAQVVGTLAGDDTVFVATPGAAAARRLARRLGAPLARGRAPRRARA
jgi:transcriptional regulator of arginine metabolism